MKAVSERLLSFVLFLTLGLVLLSRILWGYLIEPNWAYGHWRYLPLWYPAAIILFLSLFGYLHLKKESSLSRIPLNFKSKLIVYLVFVAAFIIFQYDSFLYAGGNYLINRIAQSEVIFYNWYDSGSTLVLVLLNKLFSLLLSDNTAAAFWGIKTITLTSSLLTLWLSFKILEKVLPNSDNWLLWLSILFFGPQAVVYFGFVGYEPLLVTLLYGITYSIILLSEYCTWPRLLSLIALSTAAIFFHMTLAFILPAVIYAVLKGSYTPFRRAAFASSIAVFLGVTVLTYYTSTNQFGYARYLLSLSGGNVRADYSLLSLNHISDVILLCLFFFPQLIALKLLFLRHKLRADMPVMALGFMSVASSLLVILIEPVHSIILDAPRMAALLAPSGLLFFLLLPKNASTKTLLPAALLALLVPISVLPAYISSSTADKYVVGHLEKNPSAYLESAIAFRDSYFFQKRFDEANQWEWSLPVKSPDFLEMKAAQEFVLAEQYADALNILYRLKLANPFWEEPRYLLAGVLLRKRQFDAARAELDSCLMLSPRNKEYLKTNYYYYRDRNEFAKAIIEVENALRYYPNDGEIKSDLMIYYYRIRNSDKADALAKELLAKDPLLPFPYLVHGFIAESRGDSRTAMDHYQKFIKLAPDEPETPEIRKRLNDLVLQQKN